MHRGRRGGKHSAAVSSFVVFMFIVAALGGLVYLVLIMSHVPGAKEERFGTLEPLPERLGEWIKSDEPTAEGLVREERHLYDEKSKKLLFQVRYRSAASGKIERVEPERVIKRRRVRPR